MKKVREIFVAFVLAYLTLDVITGSGPARAWLRWLLAAYQAGPPST